MRNVLFSVGNLVTNISIEEQIYIAKEAGFDGIDYILSLQDLFMGCKKINELSKEYDLPVKGIHIPLFMILYTPSVFYRQLYKLVSNFDDCEIFNVHLSYFINPLYRNNKEINKFLNTDKKKKIIVSFESNPRSKLLNFYPKETYEPDIFADYCIKQNLFINFDLSHIASFGYDINEFYKKYNEHIQLIHISDFDDNTQHLSLGEGNLPLRELFSHLKKTSYKGKIIFEIYKFPKNISQKQRLKKIKESLNFFEKQFNK